MSKKPVTPKKPLIPDHVKKKTKIAAFVAFGAVLTEVSLSLTHNVLTGQDMQQKASEMVQPKQCNDYKAASFAPYKNEIVSNLNTAYALQQRWPMGATDAIKRVIGVQTRIEGELEKMKSVTDKGYYICMNARMDQVAYTNHKTKEISVNPSYPDALIRKHFSAMMDHVLDKRGELSHDVMTWPEQKENPKVVPPNVPRVTAEKQMKMG